MTTTQRLLVRPPIAHEDPPVPPEVPHASGPDSDTITTLHAQATGVHNVRSLVSVRPPEGSHQEDSALSDLPRHAE